VLVIQNITVDARSPDALAAFWCAAVGGIEVDRTPTLVRIVVAGSPDMLFMKVDDPTPWKNAWHVDLASSEVDADIGRLVALGASVKSHHVENGKGWAVLADPEGNAFCVGGVAD
jgi:predicted enzyme related to lactoylglutathione lyase